MASVPTNQSKPTSERVDAYPYALLTLRGFNSLQVTAAYRDAKRQESRVSNTEVDAALKDYIVQEKPETPSAGPSLEMAVSKFVIWHRRVPSLTDARDLDQMAYLSHTTVPVIQQKIAAVQR
jgi:hypothetical protein